MELGESAVQAEVSANVEDLVVWWKCAAPVEDMELGLSVLIWFVCRR